MKQASGLAPSPPVKTQVGRAAIRLVAGFLPCEVLFLLLGYTLAIPRSALPGEALEELLDAVLVVPVFYAIIHGAWVALSFRMLGAANWRLRKSVLVGAAIGVGLGLVHWRIVLSHFAWWLTP